MIQPHMSIIMLSYNQGKYIIGAIQSIIEVDNVEIIVVDPGSNDDSRNKIRVLQRVYPNRIKSIFEPDQGPADGLNSGLEVAKGSIIGFLNADDLFLPRSLQYVISKMSSQSNVLALSGSGYIYDEQRFKVKYIFPRKPTRLNMLLGVSSFFQQGIFVRKDVIGETKFNVQNKVSWDLEFVLDLVNKGIRFEIDSTPLAIFRVRNGSLSKSPAYGRTQRVELSRMKSQLLAFAKLKFIQKSMLILYSLYIRASNQLRALYQVVKSQVSRFNLDI